MELNIKHLLLSLLLIEFSYESYCGSYLPMKEKSCSYFTNTTSICCYLYTRYKGSTLTMCYPFAREFYYTMQRSIEINGYLFLLNCGTKRGASCGTVPVPKSYKDCSIYSKNKNSCCYYQYKGDSGCVWLGNADIGLMKYKALSLICSENYYKFSWLTLSILFIIWIIV